MITIRAASLPQDREAVHELFAEYLPWVCGKILDEYQLEFDAASILAHDMDVLADYMPPDGLTLLAFESAALAGCACMRQIGDGIAELKRMYVRPSFRRRGIGRLLVAETLRAVRLAGFALMRLDSAGFMREAHALDRSFGFTERTPYAGSEIPVEHSRHWIFMELGLTEAHSDGAPNPIRHNL